MPLYFAYGSNLDAEQMRSRCPGYKMLSAGWLQGYRLDFTHYSSSRWKCGVADIVLSEGNEVWGLVYKITELDLEALDKCEGYPDIYTRFQTIINIKKGVFQDVWVYSVREKAEFIAPKLGYIEIIRRAAKEHKFPDSYRKRLEEIPLQNL